MLNLFIERNLKKTISFLLKNRSRIDNAVFTPISVTMDPLDILSISLQDSNDYFQAYKVLQCKSSMEYQDSIVFCPCCSPVRNFLRNHSLYKSGVHTNKIIKLHGYKSDPFLDFISVLVSKDTNLLLSIIESLPFFWEAYLLLIDLTDTFVQIDSPVREYFYSYLKIQRDISNVMNDQDIQSDRLDINTLAALNYCCGNTDQSLKLFKSIEDYSDLTFFEFFGMLLYNSDDPCFKTTVERCTNYHSNSPETYVMAGLYNLKIENHLEAKNYFKKAYKSKNTPDIACLLGYSFVKLDDHENACNFYKKAHMGGLSNFRILYSIAQGYFAMNKLDECFSYCKMALDVKEDGSIYRLLGKIHHLQDNLDLAVKNFERSLIFGEVDSFLYLAEIYKKRNNNEKVLEMYERYLKKGEKNLLTVAKYLIEYYEEVGDFNKADQYRRFVS